MAKVCQEFYCAHGGGGCGGYFTVKLNMAINQNVIVNCPNCKHQHHRVIKDGIIHDQGIGGRHDLYTEEIVVPKSAFHKESLISGHTDRTAKPIHPEVRQRWYERFASRL